MDVITREISPSERILEVTIEADKVEAAYRKAFQEKRKHLRIKGFRKGNVPDGIAKQYLTDSHLLKRVVNLLVPSAYKEALKLENLAPLGKPDWELKQSDRGQDLVFQAKLHVMPILTIPGYKGYKLARPGLEVTEDEIGQVLYQRRQGVAKYVDRPSNHAAIAGDFAFIDYQASHDGKPLPQSSVKNFLLEMQPEKFLPGFVDNMLGARSGEERQFDLTLPMNYAEKKLAGQTVGFQVKVHQLKERQVPKLDDDFAQAYTKFATLAELKETVGTNMLNQKKRRLEDEVTNEIVKNLVGTIEVEIVPAQLQEGHARLALRNHTRNLEKQGLTMEQYLAKRGISSEHFREELSLTGLVEARLEIFYRSIAAEEDIVVLKKEVDQAITNQAKGKNITPQELKAQMLKEDTYKLLAYRILIAKVRKCLFEQADIDLISVAGSEPKAKAASKKPKSSARSKKSRKKKAKSKKKAKAKTKKSPAKKKKSSKKKASTKKAPAKSKSKSKAKAKAKAKTKTKTKIKPKSKAKAKKKSKGKKAKAKAKSKKKSS